MSATPSAPSRPVHDPPATFATGHSVPLPEQAIAGRLTVGGTRILKASAIGADNGIAVIRVSTSDDSHAAAYGIDLNSPRQVWSVDKFQASATTDQAVAGALLEDELGIDGRPAAFDRPTGGRAGPERSTMAPRHGYQGRSTSLC